MKIQFTSSFGKDMRKLDIVLAQKIYDITHEIKTLNSLKDIKNLRKMVGYKHYFRIRIGDYRIGCKIEDDTVTFIRVQHRSNIYKTFP